MSMALEHKDFRQRNCEASTCIENKGPNNLQYNEKKVDGYPELKDNISYHTGGNVAGKVHPWGRDILEPPNECPWGRDIAYPCDFGSWSTFHLNAQKVQQCQMNAFTGQYYPFPMENHFQHVPFSMSAQNFPHEFQFQDFRYFVVIDFEATCDKDKNPHPQEIIEFPSVIVSSLTGQLEACFQTYVRPTLNQHLSDFCKDLTGIQQIQVDRGITLSEALLRHDKWLEKKGIKNTNFAVVTWSNWDCRVMLESECRFKKIWKPPYFNRWINLKVPFSEVFGGMRCNLKEAVEMAGLTWQGRAHCGLDDAKNTARLLTLIMGRGFKFSFTNSLMWKTSDNLLISISSSPHSSHELKDMQTPIFQSDSYCYCGVKSSRGMVRKPGPKQGNCFFGCGNWTASRGAVCHYFEWASP